MSLSQINRVHHNEVYDYDGDDDDDSFQSAIDERYNGFHFAHATITPENFPSNTVDDVFHTSNGTYKILHTSYDGHDIVYQLDEDESIANDIIFDDLSLLLHQGSMEQEAEHDTYAPSQHDPEHICDACHTESQDPRSKMYHSRSIPFTVAETVDNGRDQVRHPLGVDDDDLSYISYKSLSCTSDDNYDEDIEEEFMILTATNERDIIYKKLNTIRDSHHSEIVNKLENYNDSANVARTSDDKHIIFNIQDLESGDKAPSLAPTDVSENDGSFTSSDCYSSLCS